MAAQPARICRAELEHLPDAAAQASPRLLNLA